MNKNEVIDALNKAREKSEKRNFVQSFDVIINLKDIDLKKPEQQVDFFGTLQHETGKKLRICALVGPELEKEAKGVCDSVIIQADFLIYAKDKKASKKLAKSHDFFIAQSNVMPQIAGAFGKVLGPKGKMPNPKAGCVIPPKTNLRPLYERLQKTVKISAKTTPIIQCLVGKESMDNEKVADNIIAVYEQIMHHLPNEKANVKSVLIKTTMGEPVRLN